jgi:hypothetical protein
VFGGQAAVWRHRGRSREGDRRLGGAGLAQEAGLCGGGDYGVSDGGREEEHEVQARFLCDKLRILDEDEVVAHLRAPAGRSSGRGCMRMERAARTRDGPWPRGPATGLQLTPGLGAWSHGSSEVPRSRAVHHGVSGVRTLESADGDASQERSRRPWCESASPTPGC